VGEPRAKEGKSKKAERTSRLLGQRGKKGEAQDGVDLGLDDKGRKPFLIKRGDNGPVKTIEFKGGNGR